MSLLLALIGSGGGGYTVTANTGTYTVTGSPANLLRGYRLTAASGSYTITGQAATLTRSRLLTAAAGSYGVTGQAATILKSKVVSANAGVYGVTGNTANIVYTPLDTGYTLTAASGSYVVGGSNATITVIGGGGGVASKVKRKTKPSNHFVGNSPIGHEVYANRVLSLELAEQIKPKIADRPSLDGVIGRLNEVEAINHGNSELLKNSLLITNELTIDNQIKIELSYQDDEEIMQIIALLL